MALVHTNRCRAFGSGRAGLTPPAFPALTGAVLALLVLLGGCTQEAGDEGPASTPESTTQEHQAPQVDDGKLPLEAVKPDIRIIAGGEVPVLKPPADKIERLPAVQPPPPPPRPQRSEPDRFARPLALSAGRFSSGDFTVNLAGIEAPELDETCGDGGEAWPCGRFARAALQRLLRARTIECDPAPEQDQPRWCAVAGRSLSGWLVSQGWARAIDEKLREHETQAREASRGIWGNRP